MEIKLFTIGFAHKSAREFFTALKEAGVKRVVDVRLNNNSQLAGFSKKEDLAYFLKEIGDIDYVHLPELAPTQDILDAYKKHKGDWSVYEEKFLDLLASREIEKRIKPELLQQGCLLCSEHLPHHCHRRLVAESPRSRATAALTGACRRRWTSSHDRWRRGVCLSATAISMTIPAC